MTTSSTSPLPRQSANGPVRRANRLVDDRMIAGVCSGIAAHLGVSAWVIRLAFVLLSIGGAGVVGYLALWFLLPPTRGVTRSPEPAGLSAAGRAGMRFPALNRFLPPNGLRGPDGDVTGQVAALGAMVLGLIVLASVLGIGIKSQLLIPLVLVSVAVVLVWRQADDTEGAPPSRRARLLTLTRVVGGFVLVAAAIALLAFQSTAATTGPGGVLLGALCVLGGVGLLAAPWIQRLLRELDSERSERVRTQERADMAAHLHDSVLQTLALIQQQSHDAKAVARLARAQERDLRAWLYQGQQRHDTTTFARAVREFSADVEDEYGVAVEVVSVGDMAMIDMLAPLVAAGREACVNAAKHSGRDTVDVYAEVGAGSAELFVRDRGPGFDQDGVPDGRMGVRGSIYARMQRHGGTATIRSEPDYGTEVRLHMPLPPPGQPATASAEQPDQPAPSSQGATT